jgi:hypothetical protein
MGAFNTSDAENPWQDYSFLIVNYCSGDFHGGDADQQWGALFSTVKFRGVANSLSALEYGLKNFPKLQKLTVSGSSAGSLAVQLWSKKVLDLFAGRSEDIFVVADSFLGVLYPPSKVQEQEAYLYRTWNMCNPKVLDPDQVQGCSEGKLLLAEVWLRAMSKYPDVRFAATNSKTDFTQITFARAFEVTQLTVPGAVMGNGVFYKYAALQLEDWFERRSNFHSYLVQGHFHTFLPQAMCTATPGSAGGDGSRPRMIDWLAELVNPRSGEGAEKLPSWLSRILLRADREKVRRVRSVCDGVEKLVLASTMVDVEASDWCAKALARKRGIFAE